VTPYSGMCASLARTWTCSATQLSTMVRFSPGAAGEGDACMVMLCYVMMPLLPPVNCVEDSWGWWLHATSASGRRAPATEHIWMAKSTLVRRWVHRVCVCSTLATRHVVLRRSHTLRLPMKSLGCVRCTSRGRRPHVWMPCNFVISLKHSHTGDRGQ
jgi:hypothetical protein